MRIGRIRGGNYYPGMRTGWHAGSRAEELAAAPGSRLQAASTAGGGVQASPSAELGGVQASPSALGGVQASPSALGGGARETAAAQGMLGQAGNTGAAEEPAQIKNPGESKIRKPGKTSSPAECQTCKERKYQDGSDEGNVSFKSAAHISPTAAPAAVRAHEQEHVDNAFKKAKEDGGKVLQASVAIHTSICPECGRTFVSGGTTTTKIAYGKDDGKTDPYQQNNKSRDAGLLSGMNFATDG